jgi:hypothetical protein
VLSSRTCAPEALRSRGAGGAGPRHIPRDNDIHLKSDQFGREVREPLELPLGPALLQDDRLACHIAERVQPLEERVAMTRRCQINRRPCLAPILHVILAA